MAEDFAKLGALAKRLANATASASPQEPTMSNWQEIAKLAALVCAKIKLKPSLHAQLTCGSSFSVTVDTQGGALHAGGVGLFWSDVVKVTYNLLHVTTHYTLYLYNMHYTLCTILCTMHYATYTIHHTLYTPCTIHCTPYTIHYTPYTIHCTLYTIHYTPYTTYHAPCTIYTIHRTLHTIHCPVYTIHHTSYIIHCTPYTIHHTPYTVYHAPYTAYHTLYTQDGPQVYPIDLHHTIPGFCLLSFSLTLGFYPPMPHRIHLHLTPMPSYTSTSYIHSCHRIHLLYIRCFSSTRRRKCAS
jgi:hypothetical protein